MELSQVLPQFVELMALVYHEGRNVSRLFHLNAASRKTFGQLAELPPDPRQAWDKLINAQQRAAEAESAKAAASAMSEAYGCSLDELRAMFEHQAWRRLPMYGGARWAAITKAVIELRDAIDSKDDAAVERLLREVPAMRHNSGTVEHKLATLKARPK
jgi:hypothetical protein